MKSTLEFLQERRISKQFIKPKAKPKRIHNYEIQEYNKVQRVLRNNPFVQY